MLENGVIACPENIWGDRSSQPEYWYLTFHTLFWFDYYLSESGDNFQPPAPFGLEEMDSAGLLPNRVYTKAELLSYLDHGRRKCKALIESLTVEKAKSRWVSGRSDFSVAELLLYNMRHVQHHAAQLNLILRQSTDSAPRWVRRAK